MNLRGAIALTGFPITAKGIRDMQIMLDHIDRRRCERRLAVNAEIRALYDRRKLADNAAVNNWMQRFSIARAQVNS
jgi:hypothetical protein